ncbi:cytochrome c oxidase subunit II [Paraburkholderia guartelaensis]|uniref:Cytochrome aa3 subunit 2 n=1 Tax=Paraburkholderia guartelaensis TaxID=2546446 RepID=A0A4R5L3L3_9BURK|nr:cytochrome c oxidase subunit II [Paraburkholderia guartelaensis]TDG03258.1 cytochrome c oxidase subunit II [Paraburkholderia guartelaensis]
MSGDRPALAALECVACAAFGTFSAACRAATPLAYFLLSAGPASGPVQVLDWALAALCVGVCTVIAALLYIAIRRNRRESASPNATLSQVNVADERGERTATRIVAVGTAISSVLLLGALVAMLRVLAAVADPPRAPSLTVTVTAYDWWWKVTYQTPAGASFVTANEIHIPTGEPVRVDLQSADVVHAFWVPALAGKTQAIPGQVNHQWIEADRPGVWRGQCTQFCGPQHAHMAMEVVAQAPADFSRWLDAQQQPAAAAQSGAAQRGEQLFDARCSGCHAIRGTQSEGAQAPDLTHLASRRLIAAGTLANTSLNRLDWVAHAQQRKPESLMPDIALTPAEASDLSAWLDTLQ